MQSHYHLIGIGGIGMSCIAQLLLRRGMRVSGSDLKSSRITEELNKLGAEIFISHQASNIKDADCIIYSSAIREDNPEVQAAKIKGIPLMKRAEALAELMRDKKVITVCGSHGKTTTASLSAYLLLEAGLSPTVAVGGILRNIDTNACLGQGDFFVAEADESDGSFLCFSPKYSIATNIDYEHLDYYRNFQNALQAFKAFLYQTAPDGCVFACSDDKHLMAILKGYKNKCLFFGLGKGADIYPCNIQMQRLSCEFECFLNGKFVSRFSLSLAGLHNISNALAVIALGLELGIDLKVIQKALLGYKGAGRRIEMKFSNKDLTVIDDYAHHPTEIKATLSALRSLNSNRIVAVFQPHRYTRTKLLLNEFSRSFDLADYVIITDIYSAGEEPLEKVSGRSIYEKIKEYFPDKPTQFLTRQEIVGHILKIIRPQDLVVTLGAGDIVKTCDELVENLKRKG